MKTYRFLFFIFVLLVRSVYAQDTRESLGPKDSGKAKGPHPLTELMRT